MGDLPVGLVCRGCRTVIVLTEKAKQFAVRELVTRLTMGILTRAWTGVLRLANPPNLTMAELPQLVPTLDQAPHLRSTTSFWLAFLANSPFG